MIKLYKIQYTISPKGLNSSMVMRFSRNVIVMRMRLEEQGITGTRTSNGGSYEVLMVVKEGVPVEQFLLESIPPMPILTELKIDNIEELRHLSQNNQYPNAGGYHHEKLR
jgi:hypothetical protein